MPRSRSVKTVILEFMMYIGMFAVVGHLCENLYQKLMLQNELLSMKSDMNLLQIYVISMEMAYDNLREEIHDGAPTKKASKPTIPELLIRPTYDAYLVHRPRDTNFPGILKLVLDGKRSLIKVTSDIVQKVQTNVKDFMQEYSTPTTEDSTSTERLIKCIILDDVGGEMKNCKCMVKCSPDSELNTLTVRDPYKGHSKPLLQSYKFHDLDSDGVRVNIVPDNMEKQHRESTVNVSDQKLDTFGK